MIPKRNALPIDGMERHYKSILGQKLVYCKIIERYSYFYIDHCFTLTSNFNTPLLLLVRQLRNGPVLPLEHVLRPRVPGLGEDALFFEHRLSQRGELLGAGAPDGLVEVVPEDGDDPTGPEDAVHLRIDYKVE